MHYWILVVIQLFFSSEKIANYLALQGNDVSCSLSTVGARITFSTELVSFV